MRSREKVSCIVTAFGGKEDFVKSKARRPDIAWLAADLAPGDAAVVGFDRSQIRVWRIRSADDPRFEAAYERLWAEFGDRREMETREVIASRLTWEPSRPIGHYGYLYEMLVVEHEEKMIALRDHTAIVPVRASALTVPVVVHLSHVFVEPRWRGTGVAGWLRAFPLQAARECAAAVGAGAASITLVAEMEAAAESDAATLRRLVSYGKAGFCKVDPTRVDYAQPDFRNPVAIEASGVQPVPLGLIIRRVGRETEHQISGAEVRAIVSALYEMFEVHMRPEHMAPLWVRYDGLPSPNLLLELVNPTP